MEAVMTRLREGAQVEVEIRIQQRGVDADDTGVRLRRVGNAARTLHMLTEELDHPILNDEWYSSSGIENAPKFP
jgi:hypothetical protein